MRARGGTAALILSVALAGCSLEQGSGGGAPSSEPTGPAPAAAVLGPEWSQDSDGNVVPDFIERRIGRDPTVDDCLQKTCPGVSAAGTLRPERPQNTLLMLDSSGSMAGPAGGGRTKIEAAKEAITRFAVGSPESLNVGLMVFGHRGRPSEAGKAESCRRSEVVAPLGELDHRSVDGVLRRFEPNGWTAIGGSLAAARQAFATAGDAENRVTLITDGLETCGRDPVREARALKQAGLEVTVDVVGFDIAKSQDAQALRRIAEATGGTYTDARTGDQLEEYFRGLRERQREIVGAKSCVTLSLGKLAGCSTYEGRDAALAMAELSNAANRAGRSEEADAISALNRRARELRSSRYGDRYDTGQATQDRLDEELEEGDRRLRRRFGPGAALAPRGAIACRPPDLAALLDLYAPLAPKSLLAKAPQAEGRPT